MAVAADVAVVLSADTVDADLGRAPDAGFDPYTDHTSHLDSFHRSSTAGGIAAEDAGIRQQTQVAAQLQFPDSDDEEDDDDDDHVHVHVGRRVVTSKVVGSTATATKVESPVVAASTEEVSPRVQNVISSKTMASSFNSSFEQAPFTLSETVRPTLASDRSSAMEGSQARRRNTKSKPKKSEKKVRVMSDANNCVYLL